ncbi:MAG: hypothetical protein Q3976_02290 [Corynebacterium sp.]|nr:hypothetical protein [Corynebacterium sp.]
MQDFRNALVAERTKLTSLRSTYSNALVLIASYLLPVVGWISLGATDYEISLSEDTATGGLFILVAVVYAGNSMGNEMSTMTYAHALLTQRNRSYWLVARWFVVICFLALCLGVAALLAAVGTLLNPNVIVGDGFYQHVFEQYLTVVLYAGLAFALAVLHGSRALAVALPLALYLIIENLIAMAAWTNSHFELLDAVMPGNLLREMDTATGVIGVIAWIVVPLGLAIWRNSVRDLRKG